MSAHQISRKSDQNCGRESATIFPIKMAAVDVINYVNEPKLKRTQLDPWGTISVKFRWNRHGSYGARLYTDTQTDTQTDRQTDTRTTQVFSDPDDPNTFSQWKWLNVKMFWSEFVWISQLGCVVNLLCVNHNFKRSGQLLNPQHQPGFSFFQCVSLLAWCHIYSLSKRFELFKMYY